jgi:activator of HSP90 ATPase
MQLALGGNVTITENLKVALAPTRRQIIAGITLSGFATTRSGAQAASPRTGSIHQEIELKASAHSIFEALMDARQFREFTGGPAEINREAGGAFSLFGARIVGRNIEIIPDQRIVQAWRPANWPAGDYSIVRFELKPNGTGTRVILDHTSFAPELREHLASGWQEHYWDPLRKYLG